jgi:hypothetical protein
MSTLPDTLSELLTLAIEDLKAIAEDPRYELDMDVYHSPIARTFHHRGALSRDNHSSNNRSKVK